jgi:hypothetical protein
VAGHLSISSSKDGHGVVVVDVSKAAPAPERAARGKTESRPRHVERHEFPRAFVLAMLIVAGVEVWLHVSHWPKKMPYDLGLDEYHAALANLDKYGPADVSILGSSRARESIDLPQLRGIVRRAAGKNLSVANYAVSGARAYVFESIARKMLRDRNPPQIILVGICERDLGQDPSGHDQAPMYWNWDDWKLQWERRGLSVLSDLPTVARSYLARYYWTLRYREQLRLRIRQMLGGEKDEPSPMDGELTPWQRRSPNRTLLSNPVKSSVVKKYAATLTRGQYPDPEQRESLRALARACREKHVQLIFYELPTPDILRRYIRPGVYERFIREVRRTSSEYGARFVQVSSLHVPLSDRDFREPSHMCYAGAHRFTLALAKRVIAPEFSSPATNPSTAPVNRKHAERG